MYIDLEPYCANHHPAVILDMMPDKSSYSPLPRSQNGSKCATETQIGQLFSESSTGMRKKYKTAGCIINKCKGTKRRQVRAQKDLEQHIHIHPQFQSFAPYRQQLWGREPCQQTSPATSREAYGQRTVRSLLLGTSSPLFYFNSKESSTVRERL